MPQHDDPKHPGRKGKPYDATGSRYSPDSPPEGTPRVYAPMAERISKNFDLEYGALGDPPVRYCVIEDLDESIASLAAVTLSMIELRAKHRFCRQLVVQYGIDPHTVWNAVVCRRNFPQVDAGGHPSDLIEIQCEVSIEGIDLYNWARGIGTIYPDVIIGDSPKVLGRARDWSEVTQKVNAYRAGEWDGEDDTWDDEERRPIGSFEDDGGPPPGVSPEVAEAVRAALRPKRPRPQLRPISALTRAVKAVVKERRYTSSYVAETLGMSPGNLFDHYAYKGGLSRERSKDRHLIGRIAQVIGTTTERIYEVAEAIEREAAGPTEGEG